MQSQSSRSWLSALLVFILFTTSAFAASPTSFCKCICFSNSTIIPLNPSDNNPSHHNLFLRNDNNDKSGAASTHPNTCNDCNRKFCLDYNLPICKGAKEEDVFTTCFQRDSTKDEAVVFIFITATVGLLAWALCKPWVERWVQAAKERRSYLPVAGEGEGRN